MPPRSLKGKAKSGPSPRGRTHEQVRADFMRVMMELRVVMRTEDVPEKLLLLMTGYANVNSTGYLKAKSSLKKENLIEVKKGVVSLTEAGLRAAPQDVDPPRDNSEVQERLRALIQKRDKVPTEKLNIIFDKLLDGKAHTKESLLAAAEYNHPSSTGFLKIMSAMKDLGIVELPATKTVKFVKEIMFPFADP